MKSLLVDADDTILNYSSSFLNYHNIPETDERWNDIGHYLSELGYDYATIQEMVVDFNHSLSFKYLEPFNNSSNVLRELNGLGVRVDVVTSCGDNPIIQDHRHYNLLEVFGDIFRNVHILPLQSSKVKVFLKYLNNDVILVEDTLSHYHDAESLGIESYIINGTFNNTSEHISTIQSWDDIYKRIISDYK